MGAANPVHREPSVYIGPTLRAPRVQMSVKLSTDSKHRVNLIATADHITKSEAIDRAVTAFFAAHLDEVRAYIDRCQALVDGLT